MVEILAMATAIAAVTSGVVQAVKQTNIIKSEYLPLTAILIGMFLGSVAVFLEADLIARIWAGGISGLAATGLFEFGKNTLDKE